SRSGEATALLLAKRFGEAVARRGLFQLGRRRQPDVGPAVRRGGQLLEGAEEGQGDDEGGEDGGAGPEAGGEGGDQPGEGEHGGVSCGRRWEVEGGCDGGRARGPDSGCRLRRGGSQPESARSLRVAEFARIQRHATLNSGEFSYQAKGFD